MGVRWLCVWTRRRIAWRVLDAQYFGVAQRRKRVFLVASGGDDLDPAEVLFERAGLLGDSCAGRAPWQKLPALLDRVLNQQAQASQDSQD